MNFVYFRVRMQNVSPDGYSQAITQAMNKHGSSGLMLLFVILPNRIDVHLYQGGNSDECQTRRGAMECSNSFKGNLNISPVCYKYYLDKCLILSRFHITENDDRGLRCSPRRSEDRRYSGEKCCRNGVYTYLRPLLFEDDFS
jgi:hypothetical protein